MVTTIIVSKNRAAQLDLLLRSLRKNGRGSFSPTVIYRDHEGLYETVREEHRGVNFVEELDFQQDVLERVMTSEKFVCFMCDDGILYRPYMARHVTMLDRGDVLCYSLRLGYNTTVTYPSGHDQNPPPHEMYQWGKADEDYAYPGSIDGHIFLRDDLLELLDGREFCNPTALECALVEACAEIEEERPRMAMPSHSVYVGNPINRTSSQSNVRFGSTYPVTLEECDRRYRAGQRINLPILDFSRVNGAHTEIELQWL